MKRNVDLTENNKFSGRQRDGFLAWDPWREISKNLGVRCPWAKLTIDDDIVQEDSFEKVGLREDDKKLIHTGNKVTREQKRISRILNVDSCDCCGRPLANIGGWRRHYQLCWRCDQQLDLDVHMNDRCLWRSRHREQRPAPRRPFWLL